MRATIVLPLLLALAPSAQAAPAAGLDLVFVIDATGSMSAEIREVKERVRELAGILAAERPGTRVRLGIVAFRDRGDAFVTRILPLDPDVEASFGFLADLAADGGGDGPEDVLAALAAALHEMDWTPGEQTERQVFLVGDAPPHLDYTDGPRVEDLIEEAGRRRIVLNSIGCRSLPADGVAFFRDVAYATEGVYHHIGRIEAASSGGPDGVADAVRATVGVAAGGADVEPVEVTLAGGPAEGRARAVEVDPLDDGAGESCRLRVGLPRGLALARDPDVGLASSALRVRLLLSDGQGEERTYDLDPCLPRGTPVHIEMEVE